MPFQGVETEHLVDYGAYIKGNTGVDSLRLLAFIINFINLFTFFKILFTILCIEL